ncbi:FadR family transcriptional regulator [Vibrio sp. Isolate31]|uniref:FadR/GntR family transcriptional regulator n=1 Tax=unclassified Vibrio TaxID=2614977 RepID=UPI001EFC94FA|nr:MULTISPECIES: FadR/GntR family transcriptional regulator [unclassified Vibrio]MCG9552019.1 FadR family transcriptional regulator [Vibrio sp. Isolate32]MCG9603200.1 FadR family transcriptional regulator [Vibrio sp. Isolate31]
MTIKNDRLYITVANQIINRINAKQYLVGDKIPPERKLSEELNVSRTVIREAMVYLELSGIAEIKKGAGVFVLQSQPHLPSPSLSEFTPNDILSARKIIEGEFAKQAALNNTPELINELQQCLDMMNASQFFSSIELRHKTSHDADQQFHCAIASACQNPLLTIFHQDLMSIHMKGKMWDRMEVIANEPTAKGIWIDDHQAIFNAIKSGEPEQAESAMIKHIDNVIDKLSN